MFSSFMGKEPIKFNINRLKELKVILEGNTAQAKTNFTNLFIVNQKLFTTLFVDPFKDTLSEHSVDFDDMIEKCERFNNAIDGLNLHQPRDKLHLKSKDFGKMYTHIITTSGLDKLFLMIMLSWPANNKADLDTLAHSIMVDSRANPKLMHIYLFNSRVKFELPFIFKHSRELCEFFHTMMDRSYYLLEVMRTLMQGLMAEAITISNDSLKKLRPNHYRLDDQNATFKKVMQLAVSSGSIPLLFAITLGPNTLDQIFKMEDYIQSLLVNMEMRDMVSIQHMMAMANISM